MLYQKCKEMLIVDVSISMSILQLDIIRRALALADEQCLQLALIDVERLWNQHSEWHGRDCTQVNKLGIKRFLKWMAHDILATLDVEELQKINTDIDTLEGIEAL